MERNDIALARIDLLRKVIDIDDWDKVVFIDETDKPESSTIVLEGQGQRLIIFHAGTSYEFVPNCLLAFKFVKMTEYHEEMNIEKLLRS